ncbi:MAG: fructosamine kinase family protein [Gammaproteobacteria bacterium]|nr:fructosamine kinase family protein [Gammaproteobacteria bacterium]MBT8151977.1 fructosamine kinase family protein [Gammaproteobacteria bacterium]NND38913.1 phosphotransferase [Pseudomonadales bacterium]NNL10753.1 phosphotransferase [Pseudomonadales bacterium]NNM12382.1 phosphotransferase [Pseudomonadales bacterium]
MSHLEFPFQVSSASGAWLAENGFDNLERCEMLGSGHHECYLLGNRGDRKIVAKVAPAECGAALLAESEGLALLASTQTIRTPEILFVNEQCLLLEFIAEGPQRSDYWQLLAERLAELHRHSPAGPAVNLGTPYGLEKDNWCGAQPQHNGWFEDGHEFFAEHRLLHQARIAFDNGYLESPWIISIESICERLAELVPWQPASLLHGDLWPGNILVDEHGRPALIDPAVYYGWRESDIAMTLLFGGLPHEFYRSYEACWPMEADWRSRVQLYNLYHLLNHLNIFGETYLAQVQDAIARYA